MDDILELNRHPAVTGHAIAGPPMAGDDMLIPQDIEGEAHTRYRRLLDPLFAPKSKQSRIAGLEPIVRSVTNHLIDRFIDRREVDLYLELCAPLPSTIFIDLVGLPAHDRGFFLQFKDDILRPTGGTDEERVACTLAARDRMYAYLNGLIDERQQGGAAEGDLITGLLATEVEGERLTRQEVVNIFYLLVIAGLDTVSATLSAMFHFLARNPSHRQQLLDDPTLYAAAVEELLRFESPVNIGYRHTTEDIDLPSGAAVQAGDYIQVVWAAANLDDDAFWNPMTVDFHRANVRHIAFASGRHRCLGSHLARLEVRTVLQEFHRRIPNYRIKPGEQCEFSNFHVRTVTRLPIEFDATYQ